MQHCDFRELESRLYKIGNRSFEGTVKFAVGARLPYDEFNSAFVKVAFDLWQMNPNVEISDDFWKLDDDKKFFVKTYEGGSSSPHDKRWSVFPTETNDKLSVAYKNDPLLTLDINTLGFKPDNIVAAQKSLLKLLSTKEGMSSLLDSVDDNVRKSFLDRYPELGV